MNRFQFIKHLLDTKKFSLSQKERFLKLVSQELVSLDENDVRNAEDIKQIKKQLGLSDVEGKKKPRLRDLLRSKNLPKPSRYGDPKALLEDLRKIEEEIPVKLSDGAIENSTNSEEIKSESDSNNLSLEEIEELFEKTGWKSTFDNSSTLKLNTNKKFHNRHKVNNWLKYFTAGNTAVKFSTHPWDDDLYATYEDYIDKLNDEYHKYDFHSLQNYNADLYWNKIYPFLFQKKLTSLQISGKKNFGWGRYKIAVGWQYPSVIREFCIENFDNKGLQARTPHTMEITSDLVPNEIPGKTITTFENVVDLFKPEIQFRDNQLWVGVKTALKKNLPNHNVDLNLLDKLKGCSFYTNTEFVLKAINRIYSMIKSRSESIDVQVSCSLDRETDQYVLEILHLNSYSDMHINHTKLNAEDNGDLSILRTTLLSLCDFSIESRFKDENGDQINARIEYLYDNVEANEWKPNIVSVNKNPGGFKFILKFLE